MSRVSVIVPIYNAGYKLNRCIQSVLRQTFKDFELILVNDGSTDKSLEVCKKFQRKDDRIIIIDKKNEGSIATRRKGIESAKSEYIMFVDADDWIAKNMLETLYYESTNANADIVVCNLYKVLGTGGIIKKKNSSNYFKENKTYNQDEIRNQLVVAYLWGHPFPPSLVAKLYRKNLLIESGKYLSRICFLGEDLYFNLEVLLKAKIVKIIETPLYYYRIGGYTSKYMPSLFEDMINGFLIQQEVINEYYMDRKSYHTEGICIMLLNTFKTCLYNLFNGDLSKTEIKESIMKYLNDEILTNAVQNHGAIIYFDSDYLNAIEKKQVDYLYSIGKQIYLKNTPKKYLMKFASRLV